MILLSSQYIPRKGPSWQYAAGGCAGDSDKASSLATLVGAQRRLIGPLGLSDFDYLHSHQPPVNIANDD
jgi:hypothetical protein